MIPTHVPLVVSIVCSSVRCDVRGVRDLIRSNLGPLLSGDDHVACSRVHTGLAECEVYAPWGTSCACCKQLANTFTWETVSVALAAAVEEVEIDCELPTRYHRHDSRCSPE